ncbi:transposase [uncultured Microscilla sp.]|uniref:transposase n=1 Tax=uncultured Microscilla sp. TaxID=432653 RepID=UPI0034558E16
MSKYRQLTHTFYKCGYHIVWTPKYRYRVLRGEISSLLHRYIHLLSLAQQSYLDEPGFRNSFG